MKLNNSEIKALATKIKRDIEKDSIDKNKVLLKENEKNKEKFLSENKEYKAFIKRFPYLEVNYNMKLVIHRITQQEIKEVSYTSNFLPIELIIEELIISQIECKNLEEMIKQVKENLNKNI